MSRFWWLVWVKVAVLAVVLYIGYNFVSDKVTQLFAPYVLEEVEQEPTEAPETEPEDASDASEESEEQDVDAPGLLQAVASKVEDLFGVRIDYENMLFDLADEYTQRIIAEADEERFAITDSLS